MSEIERPICYEQTYDKMTSQGFPLSQTSIVLTIISGEAVSCGLECPGEVREPRKVGGLKLPALFDVRTCPLNRIEASNPIESTE